jgi:rod shape-determining protein MreC
MRSIKFLFHTHFKSLLFIVIVIVSILLLFGLQNPILVRIKSTGHTFFSSFESVMSGISDSFAGLFVSFDDIKQLKEELHNTKLQLERLSEQAAEIEDLRKENNQLRGLLGYFHGIPGLYDGKIKKITAMIIAKQPGNFASSFTINKGEKDGVKVDMPVIARYSESYGLVGRIVTVGFGTSIVMPLYNSSFFVAAVLDKSGYEGLVNGLGENEQTIIMQYIEKLAKSQINYDDLVVTSGLGLAFPKNIHIGNVKSIISKPYQTSMELEIKPVIDFARLKHVFVISKGDVDGQ